MIKPIYKQTFNPVPSPQSPVACYKSISANIRSPHKGVIIGAGQVGMACAYSMLIQNTFDEMVIVDLNQHKLEGEVMDLVHGLPFVEPMLVQAGTLADCEDADIVIITAGAKPSFDCQQLDR